MSRRVALVVSNIMLALATIAETDLVAALPRPMLRMHAARYRLTSMAPPLQLDRFQIRAIAPKAALMDGGLVWFLDMLENLSHNETKIAKTRKRS